MLAAQKRTKTPVISVIDDDRSIRAGTNRLIRALGFDAHTFASAEEFLQSPDLYASSCVIADIRMPGMSGLKLQQVLAEKGHALPMIFITAFPEEAAKSQTLAAGAVAFVTKPFDGKTLIRCLNAALKKSDDDPTKH